MSTRDSWHVYRYNPDAPPGKDRGKFVANLEDLSEVRCADLGTGDYVAVFSGAYSKGDGVPPIRFISVIKADIRVEVR